MIIDSLFKINLFYFIRHCEYKGYIMPLLNKFLIKTFTDSYNFYRLAEIDRYNEYWEACYSTEPIVIIVKNEVMG
jgi:hypothetical protein